MANEIKAAFDAVYVDGPSTNPTQPPKPDIRNIVGQAIQDQVDALNTAVAAVATGIKTKESVRAATTTAGTLATAYENGDTLDGVVLATNDRILVKDQASAIDNGIRVVQASGAPTRSTDADTGAEIIGATVFVREGTVNQGRTYTCNNATAPTLGVDNITFVLTSELDGAALDSKQDAAANLDDWSDVETVIYPVESDQSIPGFSTDPTGFVISPQIYGLPDGTIVLGRELSVVPGDYDYPGFATDPTGFVIPPANAASSGGTGIDEPARIAAQDAEAKAYSAAVPFRPLPIFAGLWWDYVLFQGYGQSLEQGGASPVPKTTSVPSFGISAKMVGYSVRSSDEDNVYTPFGSVVAANGLETLSGAGVFALRDAVATSDIDKNGGGTVYNYATWVINPRGGHNGEAPIISFTYGLWKMLNERRNELTGNFAGRIPIISLQGFGGLTIEDLTTLSNATGLDFSPFVRMKSFMTQLAAHIPATYAGKTVGVGAWTYTQGQANSSIGTTTASFKTSLGTLKDNFDAHVLATFPTQTVAPLMLIVQSGGHWIRGGVTDVPQAQHEFAMEQRDAAVYLTCNDFNTPSKYQVPDAPGWVSLPSTTDYTATTLNEHKCGNGYRWQASYSTKVAHRLMDDRLNWEHMHIIDGRWITGSRNVTVSWHCPVAPIVARHCWHGYRRVMMPDNGVQFFQGAVEFGITSQTFLDQSIVFELDVVPTAGVDLVIILGGEEGRHNISDSDPAVSRFNYVYSHQDFSAFDPVAANMTAGEILVNDDAIAELGEAGAGLWTDDSNASTTGLPYPLPNFAVIETFTITEITE